ncbi:MAG: hypothetical protein GXO88_08320 [Chlorobi bacterium]|nr:hypothetical protein [Chlorobiota bacterium]
MYKLDTKLYALVLEYAKDFENLTDEKAIGLWSDNMSIEKELVNAQIALEIPLIE